MPIILLETMKYASVITAVLLLLIPLTQLSSQQSTDTLSTVKAFSSLVSNIGVAVVNNRVNIWWTDGEDRTTARYRLYRSRQPLISENLSSALLIGEFLPEVETAEDAPTQAGSYYYALTVLDANGTEVRTLWPNINTTTQAAIIKQETNAPIAQVTSLRAQAGEGGIELSFHTGENARIALYRSARPIQNLDDLLASIEVAVLDAGLQRYTDSVISGVPYYYAALDSNFVANEVYGFDRFSETDPVVVGENALTLPIALPLTGIQVSKEPQKTAPDDSLPLFILDQSIASGIVLTTAPAKIPEKQVLSERASAAVATMLAGVDLPPKLPLLPVILESEQTRPQQASKQDLTLAEIVNSSFRNADYERSIVQLDELLAFPLSDDVAFKVRFYYAQCLYFIGEAEKSVLQFRLLREENHQLITPWMYAILQELGKKSRDIGSSES